MRKILVLFLGISCLLITQTYGTIKLNPDTNRIVHSIDGNINEWPTSRFETDKETQIVYSVDQDADNIYLALKIPSQKMQMKILSMGMNVYLDKKGKKREGTGIEFPVKKEGTSGGGGYGGNRKGGGQNGPGEPGDPKAAREKMASTLLFLKTFGFDDQDDKTQLVTQSNGINIATDWDDANVLYIEYQIPAAFLGKPTDLNGKPLAIGWKINGFTANTGADAGSGFGSGRSAGFGGGGGRGGGRNGGSSSTGSAQSTTPSQDANSDMAKEMSFWTKLILKF